MSLVAAAVATAAVALAFAPSAWANTYIVYSCDAIPNVGGVSAWQTGAGSVNTYYLCPANRDQGRGISTRMVGRTFSAGEYSTSWFHAPPGTSIIQLGWAGRWARGNPSWATEIRALGPGIDSRIVGVPAQPGATGWQNSHEAPNPEWHSLPFGTTALSQNTQCGAGRCESGATFHTWFAQASLDDYWTPWLSVDGVADGAWVRRDVGISYGAADNTGISSVYFKLDGSDRAAHGYPCDFTRTVPCQDNRTGTFTLPTSALAEGEHHVEVVVYDASGSRTSLGRTIRVDNTAPRLPRLTVAPPEAPLADRMKLAGVPIGENWRSSNKFTITWPSQRDDGAPITVATWELCRPGRIGCRSGRVTQPNPTAVSIQLGEDGAYELRVALEDQAGNVRPLADAQPVMLRLDTQAPRAAINELDPNEPMLAAANVTDAASGLADGQLEMRRRGTRGWHELTTTVDHSRLLATIDDERFHEGSYELRARAIDHAGNETSTGDESGSAATRQLPVRIRTRLRAGHVIIKTRRRVVGRGKHKRVVRRRTISLDKSVRVRFGAHTVLGGRLTDVNGQPLHDVPVEVSAQPRLPAAGFGPIGLVRTDKDGRFTYRVAGTQSRRLRFRYPGTSRIQPSRADVSINVPASTTLTLTPPRILNGETVTFSGRVRGGPIPTAGKLIELKKWTGRQWAPFRVVRTGPDGRWSHVEPVLSVRGLVVFKLRADVPAESGFPFAGGHSPTRRLHVRGL